MTHHLSSRYCVYVDFFPPPPFFFILPSCIRAHVLIKSGVELPARLSIVFHTMVEAREFVITDEFMPVSFSVQLLVCFEGCVTSVLCFVGYLHIAFLEKFVVQWVSFL